MAKQRPTNFDDEMEKLVEAFRENNPAVFYTQLMNTRLIYTITQTESLWNRVGEEGEVESIVYLHFLKGWERIRTLALSGGGSAPAGYLVETIRNAVRDALRKKERRQKMERSLVRGLEDRGNEAEAVEDKSGSVIDQVIAREQRERLIAAESDPEQAKFGAVYKLKMMMRCSTDELARYALTAEEAAWRPEDAEHPRARTAGRVADWLGRLRRWDEAGKRFVPTSRKLVRMLGMVRRNAPENELKDKANVLDQWFRRAKVKLAARLKE